MQPLLDNQHYMTELASRETGDWDAGTYRVEKLMLVTEIHPTGDAAHVYTAVVHEDHETRLAYSQPAQVLAGDPMQAKNYLTILKRPQGTYGNMPQIDDLLTVIMGGMATPMGIAFLLRRVMVTLWHTDEDFRNRFEKIITDFGGKRDDGASTTRLQILGKGLVGYESELLAARGQEDGLQPAGE